MKLCPECRTENADSVRFCVQCGQPLPNQGTDQPDAAFPEEEVKAGKINPDLTVSVTAATSTTDGKPIVVPSVEEQVPPHAVDAALSEPIIEEEPEDPPIEEVL